MHGGLNRQKKGACIVYLDNAQLIPIIYGKNFFQKKFGGFKKSCTFAAFKLCGFFVSAYHIKIFEYSQREGVAI